VVFITLLSIPATGSVPPNMLTSRYQKGKQTHNIAIADGAFEDMAKFKCLGTTPTDKIACTEIKAD
jgi:hypothetical protein